MKIINVTNFPEYTGVHYKTEDMDISEVLRINSCCAECGKKIAEFCKTNIEGIAVTARKGICPICKKETYITNIRNYN